MTDGTDLQDRVALVLGDAGGITERLVAAGARVVDGDGDGHEPADAERLVASVVDGHGRLDLVVNATTAPDEHDAAAIVTLELLAPLHVATAANTVMQAQDDGGVIVNVGSVAGMVPSPGAAAHGAAQAGLVHLTQSLAAEWGPKVRVNCVSVGAADGDPASVPLGRLGSAADVADAVLWLASPASAYVSGANLVVHGGGRRPAFLAAITGP